MNFLATMTRHTRVPVILVLVCCIYQYFKKQVAKPLLKACEHSLVEKVVLRLAGQSKAP